MAGRGVLGLQNGCQLLDELDPAPWAEVGAAFRRVVATFVEVGFPSGSEIPSDFPSDFRRFGDLFFRFVAFFP